MKLRIAPGIGMYSSLWNTSILCLRAIIPTIGVYKLICSGCVLNTITIKTQVHCFYDTDGCQVSWRFATQKAIMSISLNRHSTDGCQRTYSKLDFIFYPTLIYNYNSIFWKWLWFRVGNLPSTLDDRHGSRDSLWCARSGPRDWIFRDWSRACCCTYAEICRIAHSG